MPGAEPLAVWLSSTHVATLERRRRQLVLSYTDAAVERWPLNTPVVSLSMPLSLRPHPHGRAFPYFDGLLPEGEVRRTVAYDLGLEPSDAFGLLAALGRDCAGALVLQALSAPPPPPGSLAGAVPIDEAEIARRIDELRVAPLGAGADVRVSLPGIQHKLLLTRLGAGGWALPSGGAPSTHIVKPAIPGLAGSVENEAFCMRLARRVGLEAAEVDVASFGGRAVLVVERFDRTRAASGEVARVHQEDTCQALSVPTEHKYEERGGPSLADVASLLTRWRARSEDLGALARAVAFAVAVGDADRHAKNISVLHGEGGIRLAPLYDVMCTRLYPHVSATPGMYVHAKRSIDEIGADDVVAEARSWGMAGDDAHHAVAGVLEALPGAIDEEAEASAWVPRELVEVLRARCATILET